MADRDGRVQKGDRVLSINGKGLKGVTHREALAILKVRLFFSLFSVIKDDGSEAGRSKQSVGDDRTGPSRNFFMSAFRLQSTDDSMACCS